MQQGRKCESNCSSYYVLFEKKTLKLLSNAMCLPSHRQTGTPMINIQSTLHTALDLCKNDSFTVLFSRNNNSYTISTQSDTCGYTYILQNIEMHDWQKE